MSLDGTPKGLLRRDVIKGVAASGVILASSALPKPSEANEFLNVEGYGSAEESKHFEASVTVINEGIDDLKNLPYPDRESLTIEDLRAKSAIYEKMSSFTEVVYRFFLAQDFRYIHERHEIPLTIEQLQVRSASLAKIQSRLSSIWYDKVKVLTSEDQLDKLSLLIVEAKNSGNKHASEWDAAHHRLRDAQRFNLGALLRIMKSRVEDNEEFIRSKIQSDEKLKSLNETIDEIQKTLGKFKE